MMMCIDKARHDDMTGKIVRRQILLAHRRHREDPTSLMMPLRTATA